MSRSPRETRFDRPGTLFPPGRFGRSVRLLLGIGLLAVCWSYLGYQGELVGSGSGAVSGESAHGTIRWSLFAGDCACLATPAGVAPPPRQHLCTANPAGVIESDDGARIWLDARGFGLRGYDPSRAHLCRLTMALELDSDDPRYDWLGSTVGLLVSEFDDRSGRALWRAQVVA